jgi:leader peptidase (prepilin peptidase)/N-methyltransferase
MPSLDLLGVGLAALTGAAIGSFLNVVIHRFPKMLERQWAIECAEIAGGEAPHQEPFNLLVPRSRCPSCSHPIRWHENVPVLSFALLRGRCAACHAAISYRYPAIEVAASLLFAYCAWRWGMTLTAVSWCIFGSALIVLACIDWDTTLLPDDITIPLLWSGLICAALQIGEVGLSSSVWGAVAGYLSLWVIYWGFRLLTGKEGMGHGDFKLFAALGSWFGWQALVPIILMASVIGAGVGIGLKLSSRLREGGYVPFGPFLAGAGLFAMVFGPHAALRVLGF